MEVFQLILCISSPLWMFETPQVCVNDSLRWAFLDMIFQPPYIWNKRNPVLCKIVICIIWLGFVDLLPIENGPLNLEVGVLCYILFVNILHSELMLFFHKWYLPTCDVPIRGFLLRLILNRSCCAFIFYFTEMEAFVLVL